MLKSVSTSLIIRGILAVIIGIIAVVWPGVTILALVILFAIYAFMDAVLEGMRAFSSRSAGPVIGHLLVALVDVAAGVIAVVWPGPTALVLVIVVAVWAFIAGIGELFGAFRSGETAGTRALLVLGGLAFAWFGGAFARIRYDNLSSAVKLVLRGRRREETDRFIALRSHYMFESAFTLVGLQGAHEKGGVEGEVGRFRRNHLVPVPEVADLAELNRLILAGCETDLARTIIGRTETVGQALAGERPLLRELPSEPFDTTETSSVRVDSKALVMVRQNRYSVPVVLAGRRVLARVGAREITVIVDGREVARHERLTERFAVSARLDHYLELLSRKPGALAGSLALHQERERGAWPDCFDELWQAITVKVGASEAARQMVDVLLLVREHGAERVELAVRGALAAGAHDGRAVALLAGRVERPRAGPLTDLDARLRAAERPIPDLTDYDQLLTQENAR